VTRRPSPEEAAAASCSRRCRLDALDTCSATAAWISVLRCRTNPSASSLSRCACTSRSMPTSTSVTSRSVSTASSDARSGPSAAHSRNTSHAGSGIHRVRSRAICMATASAISSGWSATATSAGMPPVRSSTLMSHSGDSSAAVSGFNRSTTGVPSPAIGFPLICDG
jgi:hypothetical protein